MWFLRKRKSNEMNFHTLAVEFVSSSHWIIPNIEIMYRIYASNPATIFLMRNCLQLSDTEINFDDGFEFKSVQRSGTVWAYFWIGYFPMTIHSVNFTLMDFEWEPVKTGLELRTLVCEQCFKISNSTVYYRSE